MFIELEGSQLSSTPAWRHVAPSEARDISGCHGAINMSPPRGFLSVEYPSLELVQRHYYKFVARPG
jgi:hypothetical protein